MLRVVDVVVGERKAKEREIRYGRKKTSSGLFTCDC
jgi:hypothetical protein